MTIRTRLLLLYAVVIGLSCAGLLWWLNSTIRLRYLESMEESLVDTSVILASLLEKQIAANGIDPATFRDAFTAAYARRFEARIYSIRKTEVDLRVYVTDSAGTVIYDSDHGRDEGRDYSQWNDVRRTLAGHYGARATRMDPYDESTLVIHVAAPIHALDGSLAGVVAVGKPSTYVNQLVTATRRRVLVYAIPIAALLALIGWFASTWITRPIERLTDHARALRDGRPSLPPALSGPEVSALGRALEEMRDALEGKDYVENYVQALTHQLKAPLSAVHGAAELLHEDMPAEDRARFVANIRTETTRIQRIVERMLQLAALEKRKKLEEIEPVDLATLARAVVDELRPLTAPRRITLSLTAAHATVNGEKFLLHQALLNLLHNAIEFSPDDSGISVEITHGAGRVRVTVTDAGPGVPDYALPRVFERFYSLPRPASGAKSTGLGLSLVREIAHLHGGEARLENRSGTTGTCATFELPVSYGPTSGRGLSSPARKVATKP